MNFLQPKGLLILKDIVKEPPLKIGQQHVDTDKESNQGCRSSSKAPENSQAGQDRSKDHWMPHPGCQHKVYGQA